MATRSNEGSKNGLFGRFENPIAKLTLVGTLALGATGLAACGPSASAEKPPVATTSSPAPGATEVSTPSTPETSQPAGEVLNGIDLSNLGPVAKERAAELTPEKIASMSEGERAAAFSITLEDIDSKKNGKTAAENYAELSFAIISSTLRAGCTPDDMDNFKSAGVPTYREFNRKMLLEPALTTTFGEDAGSHSTLADFSFAKRCFEVQGYTDLVRGYTDPETGDDTYKNNKDVAAIKDYALVFKYDPSSLKVIEDGTAQDGDALSVSYSFDFKETDTYTPKQLEALMYAGANPAEYGNLKGSIKMQIEGAVHSVHDSGDKVSSLTAYAEMTSNQSADGTIS